MKKLFALALAVIMLTALFAGCKSGEKQDESSVNDSYVACIEPLKETYTITAACCVGSVYGLPFYVAQTKGWMDQVNVDLKLNIFNNGPVIVEASDTWDLGLYGLGGTMSGVAGPHLTHIANLCEDHGSIYVFVRKDSAIATAADNGIDGILGSADDWRGIEALVPIGTVQHYCLTTGLKLLGLDDKDINMVHMDIANGNTAFRAGQGDCVALSGSVAIAMLADNDYVAAISASKVKAYAPSTMAIHPSVESDAAKKEAALKALEVYFMAIDWINDNLDEAAQMYVDWCEDTGMVSDFATNKNLLISSPYYTLEDNYKAFYEEKSPDGSMPLATWMNYDPLTFFVKQGKYEESVQDLLKTSFKGDIIKELYTRRQSYNK